MRCTAKACMTLERSCKRMVLLPSPDHQLFTRYGSTARRLIAHTTLSSDIWRGLQSAMRHLTRTLSATVVDSRHVSISSLLSRVVRPCARLRSLACQASNAIVAIQIVAGVSRPNAVRATGLDETDLKIGLKCDLSWNAWQQP